VPLPSFLNLGPLTQKIAYKAKWLTQDDFPGSQVWADDVERVLSFVLAEGQFERFLPRLNDDRRSRNSALAEIRAAFFFHRNSFRILSWEPKSTTGKLGDLEIQWFDTGPIFVEIKGPDWQGELSDSEKMGERKTQLKYLDMEARFVDPASQVLKVIESNAIPKFSRDRSNLVVIVDDLFISPVGLPGLESQVQAELARAEFAILGGVLFLKADWWAGSIEYRIQFVSNPNALSQCALPFPVTEGFLASSQHDEQQRVRRYSEASPFKAWLLNEARSK
jgi:hypothetical protein